MQIEPSSSPRPGEARKRVLEGRLRTLEAEMDRLEQARPGIDRSMRISRGIALAGFPCFMGATFLARMMAPGLADAIAVLTLGGTSVAGCLFIALQAGRKSNAARLEGARQSAASTRGQLDVLRMVASQPLPQKVAIEPDVAVIGRVRVPHKGVAG